MQATLTGRQTKAAREEMRLSQAEVAATLGLNRTYYSLFEAGRYVLDPEEERRLSEFFTSHIQTLGTGPPSEKNCMLEGADQEPDHLIATDRSPKEEAADRQRAASGWEGWNLWSW